MLFIVQIRAALSVERQLTRQPTRACNVFLGLLPKVFCMACVKSLKALPPATREAALSLVTRNFCQFEPLSHHLGIKEQHLRSYVSHVASLGEEHSIVVERDRNILAVALCEEILPHSQTVAPSLPGGDAILEILEEVGHGFLEGLLQQGRVLHVAMVATDHNYAGRGYCKLLLEACLQLATEQQFKYVVAEATAPGSQAAFSHFNFSVLNEIPYKGFCDSFGSLSGSVKFVCKTLKC